MTARPMAPATRPELTAQPSSSVTRRRGGVGAAIRDGWYAGMKRGRPYLALLSGDDQHIPAELVGAFDALIAADADYVQGSRWMRGGSVVGATGGRSFGTRLYSAVFSVLAFRRVTDATNGFRVFRASILDDPKIDIAQSWLDELRPRAVRAVQGDPAWLPAHRVPVHGGLPRQGGLHEDARRPRLVAALPAGDPPSHRGEAMTSAERSFGGRRILVTGGAGFVGGAVVHRLVDAGAKVTVLDDLFTGQAETIPAAAQFVQGSVNDEALVKELVTANSLVFHLAARNIIASTKNPRDDFATNIGGTLNVLMAAREARTERVVYSSSTSIYGNPRSIPINEDDGVVPLSPYAVSKLGGEHYCLAFYESYGLPISVVRYSNIFGPGQRPDNPYCGVVSKFLTSAYAGEPLQIHGDGLQTRDFTYIDDAVEATLLAAIHPRAEGEVFNVGTGIETSVADLAQMIGQGHGTRRDGQEPRPARYRQHPAPGGQHREGPADAPLGPPGPDAARPRPDRGVVPGGRLRGVSRAAVRHPAITYEPQPSRAGTRRLLEPIQPTFSSRDPTWRSQPTGSWRRTRAITGGSSGVGRSSVP